MQTAGCDARHIGKIQTAVNIQVFANKMGAFSSSQSSCARSRNEKCSETAGNSFILGAPSGAKIIKLIIYLSLPDDGISKIQNGNHEANVLSLSVVPQFDASAHGAWQIRADDFSLFIGAITSCDAISDTRWDPFRSVTYVQKCGKMQRLLSKRENCCRKRKAFICLLVWTEKNLMRFQSGDAVFKKLSSEVWPGFQKSVNCFLTYLECSDRTPDSRILRGAKNQRLLKTAEWQQMSERAALPREDDSRSRQREA